VCVCVCVSVLFVCMSITSQSLVEAVEWIELVLSTEYFLSVF